MIGWGDTMRFCIIGLGSMGKRRIRLLKQIDASFTLIGVDTNEVRRNEAAALFDIRVFATLEEALPLVDACLVCTAPITHASIIKECLLASKHVFTELNLVADGYEELLQLASEHKVHLFLSSTLLYRKEIEYITDLCANEGNLTYSYHVGQYLPDWHPWESYEQFFVANKRTNGCRELFAIELPWLMEAFGPIIDVQVMRAKKSQLNIDYPDTYQVLINHPNGNSGVLWVDVVSRIPGRQFKVSSETLHLTWGGKPENLVNYRLDKECMVENVVLYDAVEQDSRYQTSIVENMYVDELKNYIGVLTKNQKPRYSFQQDAIVLGWIDHIENIDKE